MPISNFRDSGPPVDERALSRLEDHLGIELPADYRAFLLRTSGGRPYPEAAFNDEFGREEGGSLMDAFLSVEHEELWLTIAQHQLAFEDRVPVDLLPIGFDQGGSLVCIGIGPENHGQVFFWAMEDEVDKGETPDYRNVWRLARTFDEFIEGFFDDEAGDD